MVTVELRTRSGEFVATVSSLPYQIPPDAIMWGQRFFVRRPNGMYYEAFVHYVPPTTDNLPTGR